MSVGRLAPAIEVAAIIRRIEAQGDFGAVLRKGDVDRGTLLLVIRSRGRHVTCLERMPSLNGGYDWVETGPGGTDSSQKLAEFVDNRIWFDEDLWLLELDIAHPERFIAETTASG